jgi:hypothetical protein
VVRAVGEYDLQVATSLNVVGPPGEMLYQGIWSGR